MALVSDLVRYLSRAALAAVASFTLHMLDAQSADYDPAFAVAVFSKTAGYRHESITAGIEAIRALGAQHRFAVDATEDAALFNDERLAKYRVVVFLNTTGHILDSDRQAAFERFIQNGNGFVGIHSATDTEYDWPWYGQLVGAYFKRHPKIQPATLRVVDPTHESTRTLPALWTRTDEWYDFRDDPSGRVSVLLQLDETTYSGGGMGASHPAAWCHSYDGGRAWYTALGHTKESYADPLFLSHLLGGIQWASGVRP
jgi:type 1 glutamine amidotransferase